MGLRHSFVFPGEAMNHVMYLDIVSSIITMEDSIYDIKHNCQIQISTLISYILWVKIILTLYIQYYKYYSSRHKEKNDVGWRKLMSGLVILKAP